VAKSVGKLSARPADIGTSTGIGIYNERRKSEGQ